MSHSITVLLLSAYFAGAAGAQCDPNDPVTGLPDFQYSYHVWSAAGAGPVNLLVVPDGSGNRSRRRTGPMAPSLMRRSN